MTEKEKAAAAALRDIIACASEAFREQRVVFRHRPFPFDQSVRDMQRVAVAALRVLTDGREDGTRQGAGEGE